MTARFTRAISVSVCLLIFSALASAQSLTDIGVLGGPNTGVSEAAAINANGDVAGTSATAAGITDVFLLQNGTLTNANVLGSHSSYASVSVVGINNLGQVVGNLTASNGAQQAFLWQLNAGNGLSAGTTLIIPPSGSGATSIAAAAVNNSGAVTGTYTVGGNLRGFAWQGAANATDMTGLSGATQYLGNSINDQGQIAGISVDAGGLMHAVTWLHPFSGTAPTDLYASGGAYAALAVAINNSGQIAGAFYGTQALYTAGTPSAFLWSGQAGSQPVNLGTTAGFSTSPSTPALTARNAGVIGMNNQGQVIGINGAGSGVVWQIVNGVPSMTVLPDFAGGTSGTIPLAINDSGQVVGYSYLLAAAPSDFNAFLWQSGSGLVNLGSLGTYDNSSGSVTSAYTSSIVSSMAVAINNSGKIVGTSVTASSLGHAFSRDGAQTAAPTTLTVSPVTGTYGGTVNLSATLTSNGTGLSGQSISFKLNGTAVGSATTGSGGVATLAHVSLGTIATGTYASGIAATFDATSSYGSSNGTGALTVNSAISTTAVTSSLNPSFYGDAVTFTATVSSAAGTPTGTVQFKIDGANAGSPVSLNNGVAGYTTASLAGGTPVIVALFTSDDGNYSSSSGTLNQTVKPANTSTAVTAAPASPTYGQTVTFNAQVNNAQVVVTSGTVTFKEGANVLGSGNVSSGTASLNTSTLPAGSHTITADYSGSSNFSPSSGSVNITVARAATVTALSTSNATSAYGQSVTLSGTVSDATSGSSNVPTGTVTLSFTIPNTATTAYVCSNGSISTTSCSSALDAAGGYAVSSAKLPAGSLALTATYSGNANFLPSNAGKTQTVNKAPLTVTGVAASDRVYNATTSATLLFGNASLSGTAPGDAVSLVTAGASGAFADKNVGTNKPVTVTGLTLSGADAVNYTLTQPVTTASITAASLTVTASGSNRVYDGTTSATVTLSDNHIGSDIITTTYASASFTDKNAGSGKAIGVSGIAIGGADAGNYSLSSAGATATANILVRPLTVTAAGINKHYDGTVSASVSLSDNRVAGDTLTDTYTSASFAGANAGSGISVSVTGIGISGIDAGNYAANSTASTTADITKVDATINVSGYTGVYNAQAHGATGSAKGVQNEDLSSLLQLGPTFTNVPGGSANWTFTGNANYNAAGGSVAVTITPAPLAVTADAKTRVYGDVEVALTYSASGFLGNDSAATALTGSVSRVPGENAGAYAIGLGSLASTNYTITFTGANLSITPRPVSVKADHQTKVYGVSDPALSYQVAGTLAFTDAFTGGLMRDSGESVNSYAIQQGTLALNSNYTLTFVGDTLSITPRPVSVKADHQTKVYGDNDPALSYQVTGTLAFTDTFTGGLTRDPGESVNSYAIQQGTLALNSNYTLTFLADSLVITRKPASVTANAATKVYGSSDPALSGSLSGFLGTDAVIATFSRTAGESVASSPYTISAALSPVAVLSNYTITSNTANFTITPAPLTVTANDASKVYGANTSNSGVTLSGLTNGDTPASVGTAVAGSGASATSPVGTYTITPGGLTDPNYTYIYRTGTLTITPAPLTITADNKSKIYGDANPAFTASYAGFVGADTPASLTTPVVLSTAATAASSVGSYPITAAGATSPNYAITFANGSLTVGMAPLTITANDASRNAGAANPAFTASYSGFVNGQTSAVLGGTLAFATTATGASPAGTYPIVPSGQTSANYAITFVNGTLTVIAVNNPPHARNDSATTVKNTPVTVNVLANDNDPDGDALSILSVSGPSHGSAGVVSGGIRYIPDSGFTGTDTFTYKVSDGKGGTDIAKVTVVVIKTTNHLPDAYDDSARTSKDTDVTIDVLANDTDPDHDPLTIISVSKPDHGTAVITNGKIVYTPASGFTGADCFTYTISDGKGGTDRASVRVTVGSAGSNHPPDANDDSISTVKNTSVTINVLSNDTDADGNSLNIVNVSDPDHGSTSVSGGKIKYTPDSGYTGPDTFTYKVSDGKGGHDTAVVRITVVASANHAPNAVDDSASTTQGNAITIGVLANDSDPDGDTLSIDSVKTPDHGTVAIVGNSIRYTPAANYTGYDCFTYRISDGKGGYDTATVRLSITSAGTLNRDPYAHDDSANTTTKTSVTIDVLANDSDPDHNGLTIVSVSRTSHGSARISGSKIVYTPDSGFTGKDSFTYKISDGHGGSDTATVTVKVSKPGSDDGGDDDDSDCHHRSADDGDDHWD